jgi:Tripartite tricarboxylate transporter TctA family
VPGNACHRIGYVACGPPGPIDHPRPVPPTFRRRVSAVGPGLLPGIGTVAGTALLLPFTFELDQHAAFALLPGLGGTTTTADPISAILFGVPGHAASAATTLDGYPLTRRGRPHAHSVSHVGPDGRVVPRGPHGLECSAIAAGDALHRLRRNWWRLRYSAFPWSRCCPAVRRCAAWPAVVSASALDDRRGGPDRNPAMDGRRPLPVRWLTAGAHRARIRIAGACAIVTACRKYRDAEHGGAPPH